MKKILFIIGFTVIGFLSHAQTEDIVINEKAEPNTVFTIVEQMPAFPGGSDAMTKYINDNLVFPKVDKDNGISGTCYINFVVEKDGTVSNVRILKGITGAKECNEAAVKVVQSMPKWNPGKQNGVVVRVAYNLPVKFRN